MAAFNYMVDYVFSRERRDDGQYPYVPVGAWILSPTQFETVILDEVAPARADELHWLHVNFADKNIEPWRVDGFFDYWRESRAPQRGSFGETEFIEAETIEEAGQKLLKQLSASLASGKWSPQ